MASPLTAHVGDATNGDEKNAAVRKSAISTLEQAHRLPIVTAVANILATDIAAETYAQIVDGLPLAKTYLEAYADPLFSKEEHPASKHTDLCPGFLTSSTGSGTHSMSRSCTSTHLLSEYQAASPGSRAFKTRLFELVARAVHQIAVLDDGITGWTPSESDPFWWKYNPNGAPPTLFSHTWYINHGQYPDGVADMVGYWAENRILGGVLLFDRQSQESDSVYIHSDRTEVTYRICELLDEQKRALMDFFTREPSDDGGMDPIPIPLYPGDTNAKRVDPEEPIWLTGIYRDPWERKLPPGYWGDDRSSTTHDPLNYTSTQEKQEALGRWRTRVERYGDYLDDS